MPGLVIRPPISAPACRATTAARAELASAHVARRIRLIASVAGGSVPDLVDRERLRRQTAGRVGVAADDAVDRRASTKRAGILGRVVVAAERIEQKTKMLFVAGSHRLRVHGVTFAANAFAKSASTAVKPKSFFRTIWAYNLASPNFSWSIAERRS